MEQWLKDKIGKVSADYCEIRLEERRSVNIGFSGREVDNISEPVSFGGGVRLLLNGGWSYVSFDHIDGVTTAIEKALSNARLIGGGNRKVKLLKPYEQKNKIVVEISPSTISLEEKKSLISGYNNIILKTKGIASTRARYHDRHEKKYFINSEGTYTENDLTFTGVSALAIANDAGNIQQHFFSAGGHSGYEIVKGQEAKAEETGRIAVELLKAQSVRGGTYRVLLDTNLAGVFTHEAIGQHSETHFLFENPRIIDMMKIGRKMGSPELNIVDDGSIPHEAGFIFNDDEGVPARKNYLIRNGVLSGHLHNRETAEKMGEDVTGNGRAISFQHEPIVRMTNTYIENGKRNKEEMLDSIQDGIYAISCLGGQTNLEMFTFSALYGYEVKKGKICGMLRDIVLTGNVFETLHNITMIGNDLELHGGLGGCGKEGQSPLPVSDGSPHLLIDHVVVGGGV